MLTHNTRKHGYLLNDVLLITSPLNNTSATTRLTNFVSGGGSSDKINIHYIFNLDYISICDLAIVDDHEDVCAFQITTPDRPYIFLAETESDKRIWLEELHMSICAFYDQKLKQQPNLNIKLGWYHHVIRHTIYSAAYYGNIPLLQHFITKINESSAEGDGEELLSILNTPDESGMIALQWSVMNGHYEAVKLLLQVGSNPDYANIGGLNNSLLLACAMGNMKIIHCLLEYGISDIQSTNFADYHALLMLLFFAPAMQMIKFQSFYALQPLGNQTQYIGWSASVATSATTSPGVADYSFSPSTGYASNGITSGRFDLVDLIQALQMHGYNINLVNSQGNTPLHLLAQQHPVIPANRDMNPMMMMDNTGGDENTRISLAPSILALVDCGVDVNMKSTTTGYTPLQLACYMSGNTTTTLDQLDTNTSGNGITLQYYPDVEIIRVLLDKGALPNWKDHNKRSAFDLLILTTTSVTHNPSVST